MKHGEKYGFGGGGDPFFLIQLFSFFFFLDFLGWGQKAPGALGGSSNCVCRRFEKKLGMITGGVCTAHKIMQKAALVGCANPFYTTMRKIRVHPKLRRAPPGCKCDCVVTIR